MARSTFGSKKCQDVGLGPLLEAEMLKMCTPLWREAHLEVKSVKARRSRTIFGSSDVEKARAVVARSTCGSENVQSTAGSEHCWKLSCRKGARCCGGSTFGSEHFQFTTCSGHFWRLRRRNSARCCGGKHIWKSKCQTLMVLSPFLLI